MRALKVATIIMGVLIVAGTMTLIIAVARRGSAPAATTTRLVPAVAALSKPFTATLDEPTGTRIAGVVAIRDWLALRLEGGGLDRVVLIDPTTGAVAGQISLAR